MTNEFSPARETLKKYREQLLGQANIVATGVGYKVTSGERTSTPSIICSVTRKMQASQLAKKDRVPKALEDIPTDVVQTGSIRAFQSHTDRHRPAPGGVSIGHPEITAGTLGCLVKREDETFILSNNHVLANSNEAQVNDPILQPGPFDGGRMPDDHIANLAQFVPISFMGIPSNCPTARGVITFLNGITRIIGSKTRYRIITQQVRENFVDAAIARPLHVQDVGDQILEIGSIQGVTQGELGMAIKKSGRTTGLTTGEILQVDVSVNVQYGQGRIARFGDQLMAGAMSQGGDSGSAVLDADNRLIGLLFAGSDTTTIINRIEHVFEELKVTR